MTYCVGDIETLAARNWQLAIRFQSNRILDC